MGVVRRNRRATLAERGIILAIAANYRGEINSDAGNCPGGACRWRGQWSNTVVAGRSAQFRINSRKND